MMNGLRAEQTSTEGEGERQEPYGGWRRGGGAGRSRVVGMLGAQFEAATALLSAYGR